VLAAGDAAIEQPDGGVEVRSAVVLGLLFALSWSSASPAQTFVDLPADVRLREGFVVGAPVGFERRMIDDAADGDFDDVDVLTAALVASGVPDARLVAVRARVAAVVDAARARAQHAATGRERGDRLLRALHGTVLRRYVESQSRVDLVVDTGEFNCLSSAVLFVVAAEGLLPRPRGMISRTHAFARVDVDARAVDVETTTPDGFAIDRARVVTPTYLRRLGVGDGMSDAERAEDLKHPEEVGAPGLVAGLYSNRGVQLVREGDLEGAAIAFDRATRLSRGAQQTRVAQWRAALLNNATQTLVAAGRLDDARALLALALAGVPSGDLRVALVRNTAIVIVAQAERAGARGDDAGARGLFIEALRSGGLSPSMTSQVQARVAALDGRIAAARGLDDGCASQPSPTARVRCFAAASRSWLDDKQPARALAAARRGRDVEAVDAVDADAREAGDGALYNALVVSIDAAEAAGDCERVELLVREAHTIARGLKAPPRFSADRIMGSCWWGLGDAAAKAGDRERAIACYERARVHLPDDDGLRGNVVGLHVEAAMGFVNAGRCDDARPSILRAAALGDATRARRDELLEVCANKRASSAAERSDWSAAIVELRRGLLDVPGSAVLRDNLGAMLHNAAAGHVAGRRCDEARSLADELRALGRAASVDAIDRACPAGPSSE
jgi:tetratricopeptide (TPR) repeat protein